MIRLLCALWTLYICIGGPLLTPPASPAMTKAIAERMLIMDARLHGQPDPVFDQLPHQEP